MRMPSAVKSVVLCGWLAAVSVVVTTVPGTTAAVAAVAPVNVLANGSFETGGASLSPWIFRHDIAATLAVDTTGAADGSRAAKVTVGATSTATHLVQIRQEGVHLEAANTYTVGFWAKASGVRVINARLQSSVSPFATLIADDYTLSTTWQHFEFLYTSAGDVPNAFVGFNLAQATGDVELDGVSLTEPNLVSNGGFETGGPSLSPWIWRNDLDATLTQDTTTKFDGSASAKITVPTVGSGSHLVQLRVPIPPPLDVGRTYVVGFEIKASRARLADVRLQSPDAPYPTVAANDFTVTTAWTKVTFQWTPKVAVTNPFVGFNLAQDTGTVWIDDVTLTEQPGGIVNTIAGNGVRGFSGDGGLGVNAALDAPAGLAVDAAGNVYIGDSQNSRVRKVTPAGIISTFAGNGVAGSSGDGGLAVNASVNNPAGLAFDAAGNLYVTDGASNRVRKVTPAGIISTFAGNGGGGFSGDGGPATNATVDGPEGVAVDGAGNVYIADGNNQRVRKVSPSGIISTLAGNGNTGFSGDGGPATSATLDIPEAVAADSAGNVYITDRFNDRIRKVSPAGIISTVAGNGFGGFSGDGGPATSATFDLPWGVAVDPAGNLYIADLYNWRVRRVSPSGTISTVAGNGSEGFSGDGGLATKAAFNGPYGLAVDATGNLFVADLYNDRVREVIDP